MTTDSNSRKGNADEPPEPYLTHPGGDMMQRWIKMGIESMNFMAARVQQDLQLQEDMLKCTSIPEIQAVQQEFFKNAIEQYASEAATILAEANPLVNPEEGPAGDKTAV